MVKFITALLLSICLVGVGSTMAFVRLKPEHTTSNSTATIEQPEQGVALVQSGRTDCPVAKILNVQIEVDYVLYKQEDAPFRLLGTLNNDGTKARLTALLSAQSSGRAVMVSYLIAGYNCSQENLSQEAFLVRTY